MSPPACGLFKSGSRGGEPRVLPESSGRAQPDKQLLAIWATSQKKKTSLSNSSKRGFARARARVRACVRACSLSALFVPRMFRYMKSAPLEAPVWTLGLRNAEASRAPHLD